MHFLADLVTRLNAHQHRLAVFGCQYRLMEEGILLRQQNMSLLNVGIDLLLFLLIVSFD
jgi:hypothetical protein